MRLDGSSLLALGVLVLSLLALSLVRIELLLLLWRQLLTLLSSQRHGIVTLVPRTERNRIHDDDHSLDQGLCADQLVSGGAVGGVDDASLAGSSCKV